MKKRASKPFTVIVFVLAAAVVAFAFIHSAMPADLSDSESENVLDFLTSFLRAIGISAELTDYMVRKAAHFAEYTAMGMLFTSCAYCFDRPRFYRFTPHIMLAGLLTAVIDETIQLGTEGRAALITDVWLDFAGIVTGYAVMLVVYIVYLRLKIRGSKGIV
ncbi:MAG TPA: VanZ family protein [Ruminococcaceae bacterium]|nr:VanZ family protein [Oscillospiraceae bacterium]